MFEQLWGDEDDDGPAVTIVEDRPPLREGKIYLGDSERATIGQHLETAYVALNHAFRDIWIPQDRQQGETEYWDEDDVYEVEALALEVLGAVERAWKALTGVVDAHTAQQGRRRGGRARR